MLSAAPAVRSRSPRTAEEIEKVAGGVPILHPGHHYDPPAKPEEPEEGGAEGTW